MVEACREQSSVDAVGAIDPEKERGQPRPCGKFPLEPRVRKF
jgi:hypothetical protein